MKLRILNISYVLLITVLCSTAVNAQKNSGHTKDERFIAFEQEWNNPLEEWGHVGTVRLDSVDIDESTKTLSYYFNKPLSYIPWRSNLLDAFINSLMEYQKDSFPGFGVAAYTNSYELSTLIPNIYNKTDAIDSLRLFAEDRVDHIRRSEQAVYSKGLIGNHLALWHSHGWYYESKLDRWEWQRARLFGSVEDISPMVYVLPYIAPMLENAGAVTYIPRERCFSSDEIIIDNDASTSGSKLLLKKKLSTRAMNGFKLKDTLFVGDNPFLQGTSILVSDAKGKVADYIGAISDKGEYAVYIAYQQNDANSDKVRYTIHHSGGSSSYIVNQQMGGGTWVYLGTYLFNKGKETRVEVSGNGQISLDAVKIGGGMGNIARRPSDEIMPNQWSLNNTGTKKKEATSVNPDEFTWKTSQRPRFMEAGRYWLQYAGMPDTLVYSLNDEKNDYNDDYQSRGEWVDYLMGAPNGPTKDRDVTGLKIPLDLAFAFHTDAGVTPNDSVIGTLGIYSAERDNGTFPNGTSKLASRDLTDVIQTQIVNDIRALYNEEWTRRGMWDKQYSEAWRPNVPTMLLELLSHQNIADMKFGLDPHFRFDVSRAIYKGILKFQAFQEGRDYVVQPLPVDHLALTELKKGYQLSWKPVMDSLELTAVPEKYKVYTRIGSNGFDNGTVVEGTAYTLPKIKKGQILSFKVTALNDGGESFASEILSIGIASKKAPKVLVVNAFDRISAPAFVDEGNFAGVAWWNDQGVPDNYEYAYTGHQYDFNRQSPWLDDDSPGWGASYANDEGKIIKGNSRDNVIVHGQSILKAGYSFISVSDEVFESADYDASSYKAVDIILGEEKTTASYKGNAPKYKIYTPAFMDKIKELTANKQCVFMSGAYVGSDIKLNNDTLANDFAADVLRFKWRTNHAVKNGSVYSTDYAAPVLKGQFEFNTVQSQDYYTVEAPDGIEPVGINAVCAYRYNENNVSAGIMYNGEYKTVILGFPFETVMGEKEQDELMMQVLKFFYKE
ncbi:MAG: xanthan lyase [Bacteroidales bacterium]|nr:xanthan lyase [Bacteroidales bacterium]